VSTAADAETTVLELDDGGSVPALLYAGGTTGLVLLAESEPGRAFCAKLGELAEAAGISALSFAGEIRGSQVLAASRGLRMLESLGVEQTVLVGLRAAAAAVLGAAARGAAAAVTLIDPIVPHDDLEPLLADLPAPKLVLARANDAQSQATAEAAFRHAIGPIVIQHLWAADILAGDTATLAAEATLAFAVGVCGDGRPA
jgi:hypothetical protein